MKTFKVNDTVPIRHELNKSYIWRSYDGDMAPFECVMYAQFCFYVDFVAERFLLYSTLSEILLFSVVNYYINLLITCFCGRSRSRRYSK